MKIITLDSQILSAIMKCPRYTEYAFIRHLEPLEKAVALDKGSLLHEGLKVYYRLKNDPNSPAQTLEGKIELAAQAMMDKVYQIDLDIAVCNEVISNFKAYCAFYKDEDWEVLKNDEGQPLVEVPFSKVIYQDDQLIIVYEGISDLLVNSRAGKLVVDHKSTSRNTEPYMLSNQFLGYCWAYKVNNVCVNSIGFQKTYEPAKRFLRFILSYPDALINEWVEVVVSTVKDYLKNVEEQHFPPRFTSCRSIYGDCAFAEVCSSEPSAREWKLKSMYQTREAWDPGKVLE